MSLRLDIATIAKIHSDRIYDLILPEREDQETVTVPLPFLENVQSTGQKLEGFAPGYITRALERLEGDGEDPTAQEWKAVIPRESLARRGRVPEGGGVGGEGASVSSTTQAPSSPGPAEPPPADTRPIRGRPGGARVFSDRHPDPGWATGLARGGLAFAVVVALGQAVAFAVNVG